MTGNSFERNPQVDIALIGSGRGARHAEWLAACPGFTVVEPDTDPPALIRREGLDAVVVATPTHAHAELVTEALRRDLLVVCETPLAPGAPAALKLAELAASLHGRAHVPFQWRENPALQSARSSLLHGAIGELVALDITLDDDSHAGPGTPSPWRESRESAGGGALADLGCHAFDLLLWATGVTTWEVTSAWLHRVHDSRRGPEGPVDVDVDDVAQVELVALGHPARARVMVSRVTPERRKLEFSALGTRGTLRVVADTRDGSAVLTLTTGGRTRQEQTGPHPMNPYLRLADDLATGTVTLATFDDGLAAVNLMDAAIRRATEAHRTGYVAEDR
ncbi:Gfo/Idh/MocA family oxidoreductase [Streptomyces cinnamoneus]|uniref:Gfo/Idh/MocA family protein n=1 Tax=Streptomyces cinnamoneus TaxID=53446 RepID=UPI003422C1BC